MLKRKGFTLVELLVVLVIIGILVALILPNALKAIHQANVKECASNIRAIDTALQMYYSDNRSWPTNIDAANLGPYFPDTILPACKATPTVAYTLDMSGQRVDKTTHFTTWPTGHK